MHPLYVMPDGEHAVLVALRGGAAVRVFWTARGASWATLELPSGAVLACWAAGVA